jgi:hypothetical protein
MVKKVGKWRELLGRLGAELVVIVLGITIALWADAWVAERQDRAIEAMRLAALQENITRTLSELRLARDAAAGGASALRELVVSQAPDRPNGETRELLSYALFYGADFRPELNVYDDLKSSGELSLLSDTALRQTLATMDARLEIVQLAQDDLASVQQLNVDSYMIQHLDLRSLYGSRYGLDEVGENLTIDLGFISDKEFQNLALLKLDVVSHLDDTYENAQEALSAVQEALETQVATQSP